MTDVSELTNYDSIADIYLAHTERPDSWNNLYERPYMLSKIHSLQDKSVLDLGCGSGFYTKRVLEMGAHVTAIDASKIMIDRLSSSIKSPKLRLIHADITKPLSFLESESFGWVICSLVLHYVEDWEPLLSELHRVMRKNGKLIISTHHPFTDYLFLDKRSYFENKLVEDTWGRDDHLFKVHYYTRSLTDVLQPIITSQFNIESIEEPLPTERIKEVSPESYERLSEKPGFLFIVLKK